MSNVLVVGASKGIGRSIVENLLERGDRVVGVARDTSPLSDLETERFTAIEGDALEPDTGKRAVEAFGDDPIEGFVYSIGTINLKPFKAAKEDEWGQAFERNVMGAVRCLGSVLPVMSKQKSGSVVLFSSTAARIGLQNHAMVSAAKGAVEGLAKALASDLVKVNIRVNTIAPGLVDTPMAEQITKNERALEASKNMHPMGRIARPDEVAKLACYLLSDDAAFMTGQVIAIDGGLSTIKTL